MHLLIYKFYPILTVVDPPDTDVDQINYLEICFDITIEQND